MKTNKFFNILKKKMETDFPSEIDVAIYKKFGKKKKNFRWQWVVVPALVVLIVVNVNKQKDVGLRADLDLMTKIEVMEDYDLFVELSDDEWKELVAEG